MAQQQQQQQLESRDAERARSHRRRRVIKHLVIFQIKLLLEGLKDLVLGPLSIAAAVFDLILAKDAPDRYLDAVMRLGQRYEDWLGLYRIGEAPSASAVTAPVVEVVQVVQVRPPGPGGSAAPAGRPQALPHDAAP